MMQKVEKVENMSLHLVCSMLARSKYLHHILCMHHFPKVLTFCNFDLWPIGLKIQNWHVELTPDLKTIICHQQ